MKRNWKWNRKVKSESHSKQTNSSKLKWEKWRQNSKNNKNKTARNKELKSFELWVSESNAFNDCDSRFMTNFFLSHSNCFPFSFFLTFFLVYISDIFFFFLIFPLFSLTLNLALFSEQIIETFLLPYFSFTIFSCSVSFFTVLLNSFLENAEHSVIVHSTLSGVIPKFQWWSNESEKGEAGGEREREREGSEERRVELYANKAQAVPEKSFQHRTRVEAILRMFHSPVHLPIPSVFLFLLPLSLFSTK